MNTERIRGLVKERSGVEPATHTNEELTDVLPFFDSESVRDYLTKCLPTEDFSASGVWVKSLASLRDENAPDVSPGEFLNRYGYLVIASSVGGNVICVDGQGSVYWADHSSFYDAGISYKDRGTGQWVDLPMSSDNVARALVRLSHDLEAFLASLLRDELDDTLSKLD